MAVKRLLAEVCVLAAGCWVMATWLIAEASGARGARFATCVILGTAVLRIPGRMVADWLRATRRASNWWWIEAREAGGRRVPVEFWPVEVVLVALAGGLVTVGIWMVGFGLGSAMALVFWSVAVGWAVDELWRAAADSKVRKRHGTAQTGPGVAAPRAQVDRVTKEE